MLGDVVGWLALPVALVWALPAAAEGAAMCRAAARRRTTSAGIGPAPVRLLVLVPAHNESLLIDRCVRSLMSMRHERSVADVIVIADNCEDTTAAQARDGGAVALERHDLTSRGKPHAIAWAMAQLPVDTYDAVVIVDADTIVEPTFADALAAVAPLRDRAAQGYFGLSNERDSWLSLLAGLLARVRYEGQYALKARAGLNCPLTGNGMCLGTALLERAGWPSDSLTENWELYARYTVGGDRILYVADAVLHAQETNTVARSSTQRTRWQAGRFAVLRHYLGALLTSPRVSLTQRLDALAELSSPGPIVHATVAFVFAIALAFVPARIARVDAAVFALSVLPMLAWTVVAWARSPDRVRIALALARLPFYAVWRVTLAVAALGRARGLGWQRSPRHAESD